MTVLLLAAGLLILFLLGGWLAMRAVCGRCPLPDLSDAKAVEQRRLSRTHPGIAQAQVWLKTQPIRDLQVVSGDNKRLHGRFVPCENARGTLVLFHGWHSSCDLDYAPTMSYYHSLGFNLVLIDQRAHGQSQGRFLTFGVRESMDVLSWTTYLSLMLGEAHPLFLCGVSMGAATVCMAADLELPPNVRGIVADCGYTSPYEIVRHVLGVHVKHGAGVLTGLSGFFARLYCGFGLKTWSSLEALAKTKLPVLLLHGEADQFVPCDMSRRLQEVCSGDVQLLTFPGADHCMSYPSDPVRYGQAVEAFFNQYLQEESSVS